MFFLVVRTRVLALGAAGESTARARVAKRRRLEKTPSTSTMSDNPRSPRGGAQTRPASERTPSSFEVPSRLRTTSPYLPAGAAAARASGGGALPFTSGASCPTILLFLSPPRPRWTPRPLRWAARARRPRRVLSRWVKKGSLVAPNDPARRDSLGSDGVSHHPVPVPPPRLGDEARAPPSEETDARRRLVGDFLSEGYETDACFFVDLCDRPRPGIDGLAFWRAHDASR